MIDTTKRRYSIAILVLVAWLSQVVYFFPPPTEAINKTAEAAQELDRKGALARNNEPGQKQTAAESIATDVKAELWRAWLTKLAIVVVGLISGLMALFSVRFWQLAVIVAALLYVLTWAIDSGVATLSFSRAYEIKWAFSKTNGTVAIFVHRDIVLPLLYLFAIVLTAIQLRQRSLS